MNFFSRDLAASPLDELLTKWHQANPDPAESSQTATSNDAESSDPPAAEAPTLEQFLGEEDILRECRSENKRLIAYICHCDTIRALVHRSFKVPAELAAGDIPNGPGSTLAIGEDVPEDDARDEDKDRQLNYAYVASELLSADNKQISDAILKDRQVMDIIFSAVEDARRGALNTVVALHFSKLIISLLKMRNSRTIDAMSERGPSLITGILKHMDSAPIAELVVRMLDGPEPEQGYGVQPNKKPAGEALDLLAHVDILGGLAECFKQASSDIVEVDAAVASAEGDEAAEGTVDEAHEAFQRRLREETMCNVTAAILGLTERVLQLPDLGCAIPPKLSPYSTPEVMSRLLDAGLYASCNGRTDKDGLKNALRYTGSSEERVEAFSLRSNSALLHSLGLAADLMTTEANVVRDEEDEGIVSMTGPVTGPAGRGMPGVGRPLYAGRGIAPPTSVTATSEAPPPAIPPPDASPEELRMLAAHAKKKAGDAIVETTELEAELALRFPRLSEMFGEDDEEDDSGRLRPLGSLRLKLAEFFVACMKKAKQGTVNQIVDLGVPKKLLELFSKYQWSSMLHGVVTKSIVAALEGEEVGRPARSAWFGAGLIPWLIDSWSQNAKGEEENTRRTRAGYMGHLIRIGTSLRGYIEENQENKEADLPSKAELHAFAIFAEQKLAPAHHREATPLCGEQMAGSDTEGDEGEEATDVLEMGGISFVENLSRNTPSPGPVQFHYSAVKKTDDDVEEEEEIKPVEVDDLDHFGADDEDVQPVKPLVDHDIPPSIRDELAKADKTAIVTNKVEAAVEDSNEPKRSSKGESKSTKSSQRDNVTAVDEFKGVIDTVDSSSEDEGSYIAFVDDRKEADTAKVSADLSNLRVTEPESSTSLDGIVTEIEEPGPLTPGGEVLQSLAANIISVADDANVSSDEEYETWEDPAGVIESNVKSAVESPSQASEKAGAKPKSVG